MFTIKVDYQSTDKPANGKKVSIYVREVFAGGVTPPHNTQIQTAKRISILNQQKAKFMLMAQRNTKGV